MNAEQDNIGSMSLLAAVAALMTAVGTIWQMVASAMASVGAMSGFLADYNEIARRESKSLLAEVPWWNRVERRRRLKTMKRELPQLLNESELQLSDAYDRAAWGWALLSVGALTATYVAVLTLFTVP